MGLTIKPFMISLEDFQHLKMSLRMISLDTIRRNRSSFFINHSIYLRAMLTQIGTELGKIFIHDTLLSF